MHDIAFWLGTALYLWRRGVGFCGCEWDVHLKTARWALCLSPEVPTGTFTQPF